VTISSSAVNVYRFYPPVSCCTQLVPLFEPAAIEGVLCCDSHHGLINFIGEKEREKFNNVALELLFHCCCKCTYVTCCEVGAINEPITFSNV
jgi:hypothetical protein